MSKETAVLFPLQLEDKLDYFFFFSIVNSCKEAACGASLAVTSPHGLILGCPWRSCWLYPPSSLTRRLSVLGLALEHRRLVELSFEVCSCSRADAWQGNSFLCQEVWGQRELVAVTQQVFLLIFFLILQVKYLTFMI